MCRVSIFRIYQLIASVVDFDVIKHEIYYKRNCGNAYQFSKLYAPANLFKSLFGCAWGRVLARINNRDITYLIQQVKCVF